MSYKEYKSPSFLEAYKNAFASCLDFDGRSRRAEFWKFFLVYNLLFIIIFATCIMLHDVAKFSDTSCWIILGVFVIIHFLPLLSIQARRLHDCGRSSKLIFFIFIPFVGSVASFVLFVYYCFDSEKGNNNWGESPKYYIENE